MFVKTYLKGIVIQFDIFCNIQFQIVRELKKRGFYKKGQYNV